MSPKTGEINMLHLRFKGELYTVVDRIGVLVWCVNNKGDHTILNLSTMFKRS